MTRQNKIAILDSNFLPISNSNPLPVTGGTGSSAVGMVDFTFDSVTVAYPNATTEVYTFSDDSSTVATITLVYSSATKSQLSSAVRS